MLCACDVISIGAFVRQDAAGTVLVSSVIGGRFCTAVEDVVFSHAITSVVVAVQRAGKIFGNIGLEIHFCHHVSCCACTVVALGA